MSAAGGVPAVSLHWLLEPWGEEPLPSVTISGIGVDSRSLSPGALFVALPGGSRHGLTFVPAALDAGAAAVAWDPETGGDAQEAAAAAATAQVPMIPIPGLCRHLGAVAARLHGDPSRALEVVAVTGTDGKTSVTHFVAQLLSEPGAPWGMIGTLGYGLEGQLHTGGMTTPDPGALQAALAACRDEGACGVAMEASSHALEQGRLAGTEVDLAVLTHLGRDHLDYHGSMEAYADAKSRLFELASLRGQVLNLDDDLGRRLYDRAAGPVLTYSADGRAADLVAEAVTPGPEGLRLTLCVGRMRRVVHLPLFGRFNVANVLAAVAAALALGRPLETLLARLPRLRPVPGRMEWLPVDDAHPLVVVDYAHTPGALEQALTTLREHANGQLTVVFGCGGDRDPGKRPLMGAVAARLADRVIITDDNPRSEPPASIRAAIAVAAGAASEVVPDRGAAIRAAIEASSPGDVVLIAGKGHETSQEVDGVCQPFCDRTEVLRLLGDPGEGGWIR
ncbi:MAG: UDP-N-acetylmuramoyl-L-alanyl-D-glutamate--2,6-diaminopimelate ligase [Halorhodospira sp.]